MKEIQSAGGPLVGLDRDHLELWTGIWGKEFIGESAAFSNDYEAACYLTGGGERAPRNIAKLTGAAASGLLIAAPNCTAVLNIDQDAVYMAQIECCGPEWNYNLLSKEDFERAVFKSEHNITFSCKSCTYAFLILPAQEMIVAMNI